MTEAGRRDVGSSQQDVHYVRYGLVYDNSHVHRDYRVIQAPDDRRKEVRAAWRRTEELGNWGALITA